MFAANTRCPRFPAKILPLFSKSNVSYRQPSTKIKFARSNDSTWVRITAANSCARNLERLPRYRLLVRADSSGPFAISSTNSALWLCCCHDPRTNAILLSPKTAYVEQTGKFFNGAFLSGARHEERLVIAHDTVKQGAFVRDRAWSVCLEVAPLEHNSQRRGSSSAGYCISLKRQSCQLRHTENRAMTRVAFVAFLFALVG